MRNNCYICDSPIAEHLIKWDKVTGKQEPCSECRNAYVQCYYELVDVDNMTDEEVAKDTEMYYDD